ncbi:MAG TPA: glutamine--tRNA ligase/YqeY domain fusion protein [Candidatus Limnocylindria bacterium]|nr:glutamine--tRNA ligase/YqeY domain fusion protein [Candidatus Limnocylindria bacterium]
MGENDNGVTEEKKPSDFIRDFVAGDLASGKYTRIVTRFPPEPNGYLHIGHAKSICLNFGIARENQGQCNLRMDDTNPAKEDTEYVESIITDVRWLISDWADTRLGLKPTGKTPEPSSVNGKPDFHLPAVMPADAAGQQLEPFYASDYFQQIYDFAVRLIEKGKAYVCDLSPDETDRYRGTPDRPGQNSPWRERSVEENLDLFQRMKNAEYRDGARTLRAKIDMASPNIWLRDPVIYRIRHTEHHHTGRAWCIYPMYDFAHCLSDYIEGVTHSICTLEFEVHRPLYDWILTELQLARPLPHQYEFARLNLGYTLMSKRKLLQLVNERIVTGWDDPRMPTISGLRRRGVTAEALRDFAYHIGVTKYNGLTDVAVLEKAIRDDLNKRALRRLAVLRPIKLVLTNLAPDEQVPCNAVNNPEDPASGTRPLALTREIYIEADDFQEVPPPKFFRLRPGGEVRLKYACIIRCDEVIKDATGKIVELRGFADLTTRTGEPNSGKKVKGTIHWVSATQGIDAEVRLYDRLFTEEEPEKDGRDFKSVLNPHSLEVLTAKVEPSLANASATERYQFERLGYFSLDTDSPVTGQKVFNRTISLKDTWAKESSKG